MRDPVYGEIEPEVWIRCLLCNEVMERSEWEIHDCEIIGWEEI